LGHIRQIGQMLQTNFFDLYDAYDVYDFMTKLLNRITERTSE